MSLVIYLTRELVHEQGAGNLEQLGALQEAS